MANIIMDYYDNLTRLRGFQKAPVRTVVNAVNYQVMKLQKRASVIELDYGGAPFRLKIEPRQRHMGSAGIFLQREYYEPLLEYGHQLMKPGDVVIDGGANQGTFTCAFGAKVGPQGRVIAFEPFDWLCDVIQTNVTINGFDRSCIVKNFAVSDEVGEAVIDNSLGPISASITRDFSAEAATTDKQTIRTTTIDAVMAEEGLERLDFVKLDVEGAELKALQGAKGSIERHKPVICVEAGETDEFGEIRDYIQQFDYRMNVFDDTGVFQAVEEVTPPLANVFFSPRDYSLR